MKKTYQSNIWGFMKTKKKESVNLLKKRIRELEKENDELIIERHNYRYLIVKFYEEALKCIDDEKNLSIRPAYIVKRSAEIFARSSPFTLRRG